jgi:hypothetical protein
MAINTWPESEVPDANPLLKTRMSDMLWSIVLTRE